MNTYLWIHMAAGFAIVELIIQLYAAYFATPKEKEQARKISYESLDSLPSSLAYIPFLGSDLVTSALAKGPYSIAPVTIVGGFIFVWYLLIPTILISFVAPIENREAWFSAIRIIGGGGY